ncbi:MULTISPECIES: hypothetical protein [Sphingomonas]|jgi:hypothetical protein|uniref:hypothetical protein n=1 Tax=Sphingomonas TaxID=13687 RepID=UPI00178023F6|nr:hypothetical protein [Sphingomonas sp. CFBP 13733]MBD8639340.1 hypothetical protein [Sphingomonas sp. CFBP 13733]
MKASLVAKIAGGIGFALIIALVAPVFLLGGLLILGSERTIYQRVKSPDGWHEARVQFDDGGAVSGFARLVFVKYRWNVSDTPLLSCRAFWGNGEAKVHLVWKDANTLLILHRFDPKNVEAVAQNCGPIRIIARAIPPFESYN